MPRAFICTGEASGEAYGSVLTRHLIAHGITVEGCGSDRMREAGATIVAENRGWGAISIVQSLKVVPRVFGAMNKIKRSLRSGEPGLFIPIDFGYLNIRLSRFAKAHGWKVLYFVPPGSWRRDRQGKDLPYITDAISTPFSWSADILNGMGAEAHWFGHPIKELLGQEAGIENRDESIGVLPGSRMHEIDANLPLIAAAVPSGRVMRFALASTVDKPAFEKKWAEVSGRHDDQFVVGNTSSVLRSARAAIVCSGTATLEAALCRCPCVVVYMLTPAMRREIKLLRIKRPKYVALPNILLDRAAVPELIDPDVTPERVKLKLVELLDDANARKAQLDAFEELDRELGPADAITRTAELAVQMMRD